LTQEFVAMMLDAARPTVTVVAGTLQQAGLIKYRHGKVTIVDREGLEQASCECYFTATATDVALNMRTSRSLHWFSQWNKAEGYGPLFAAAFPATSDPFTIRERDEGDRQL
jgi:hypothetical protein